MKGESLICRVEFFFLGPVCSAYIKLMQEKVADNMSERSDAKGADLSREDEDELIESDIELDNTDVVEPDNDPPQKVFDWH